MTVGTPPGGPVSILPIGRSKKELHRFFDVADRIYAGDPHWVPPLRDDVAKVFVDSNPLFEHAEMQLFLAQKGGLDAVFRTMLSGGSMGRTLVRL